MQALQPKLALQTAGEQSKRTSSLALFRGLLSSSPQEQQRAAKDDDNVDEAMLESLHGDNDLQQAVPEQTPPIVKKHAPKEFRERYRQALVAVLGQMPPSDPLVKLNESYQKRGIASLKANFTFRSKRQQHGAIFWQCTFCCPVTLQIFTSSDVACLLLDTTSMGSQQLVPNDNAAAATAATLLVEPLLGAHQQIDGVLYYASKKAAKKSSAVAVLLEWFVVDSQTETEEKAESTAKKGNTKEPPSTPLKLLTPQSRKKLNFPWWVQTLYESGVTGVGISYRQQESTVAREWKADPVPVVCDLVVSEPFTITVTGKPATSRSQTRDSAVEMLSEMIAVRREKRQENESASTALKKHLLSCDASATSFFQPVPYWANASFANQPCWYLYELVFRTKVGTLLVQDRMKLDSDGVTRVGMLFPCTIEPSFFDNISPIVQAEFGIPAIIEGDTTQVVSVDLRNRSLMNPSEETDEHGTTPMDRIDKLKRFNQVLMDWKVYGMKSANSDLLTGQMEGGSAVDRTYLFVPLCRQPSTTLKSDTGVSIDWQLVDNELQGRKRPFLSSPYNALILPFFGETKVEDLSMLCLLLCVASLAPLLTSLFQRPHLPYSPDRFDMLFAGLFFTLATAAGLASALPPIKNLPGGALHNSFLCHRNFLYVLTDEQRTTLTSSSIMPLKDVTTESLEKHRRKYRLNLQRTSFVNYYIKKHGLELRYPQEKLLQALTVDKQTSHDSLMSSSSLFDDHASPVHLVPELISVLAIPRDFLYTVGMSGAFMPELERVIRVSGYAGTLLQISMEKLIGQDDGFELAPVIQSRTTKRHQELSGLLSDATSLFPTNAYERLEFLGDTILGFFLALKTVSQNASLVMDSDDIGDAISDGGKNKALVRPALQAGLPSIIRASKGTWRSIYCVAARQHPVQQESIAADQGSASRLDNSQLFELANSTLSDIVESMLAATFLSDTSKTSKNDLDCSVVDIDKRIDPFGATTVALLERMSLLPIETSQHLRQSGLLLHGGYPFQAHAEWLQRLESVKMVFEGCDEVFTKLCDGFRIVVDKLTKRPLGDDRSVQIQNLLDKRQAQTLLFCALFDDSLNESSQYRPDLPEGSSLDGTTSDFITATAEENFFHVALVRDSLYHVGAYGLQLLLTKAIFDRHPQAEPGDLHLLRSCAMADDAIVYIMMKAGLCRAMFDQASPNIAEFESKMTMADIQGRKLWNDTGGWLLGLDKFRKRRHRATATPQYPGLLGGRLVGENQKLCKALTSELMFSFKAIVGALILSLGLERTWTCLDGFFDEVLLLSPAELRSCAGASTLVASYESGGKKKKKKK